MKAEYPDAFYDSIMELTHYDLAEYLPRLASFNEVENYLKNINTRIRKEILEILEHPNGLVWRETGDSITIEDSLVINKYGVLSIRKIFSDLKKSKIDHKYLCELYHAIVLQPEFKIATKP